MAVETGNERSQCVRVCVCAPRKLGTEKDNKGEWHNAYRSFQRRTRAEDWKKVVVFGFHLRRRANVQPYRDRNKRGKECL